MSEYLSKINKIGLNNIIDNISNILLDKLDVKDKLEVIELWTEDDFGDDCYSITFSLTYNMITEKKNKISLTREIGTIHFEDREMYIFGGYIDSDDDDGHENILENNISIEEVDIEIDRLLRLYKIDQIMND